MSNQLKKFAVLYRDSESDSDDVITKVVMAKNVDEVENVFFDGNLRYYDIAIFSEEEMTRIINIFQSSTIENINDVAKSIT
jgi:hypothetical protein